ncbi:Gfo/Idh/MocA family oxidoreductase [Flagellimonas hymeniacidonis]|uniref:Gfo/Idh/MocA family oxidoreductase n=1 Tax=Flagellimonas hymeniacidonis TaxID=2603628 RepID=A0A5C8V2L8_9FLAO|nr:Gfo/Idh/MocA family oxidoreductase [Flagellimonas hymeniacidonis]TXN35616.1 Gfo/Idh/MocA family oxidoreductase [Flagellimonas hymeniacidonis]
MKRRDFVAKTGIVAAGISTINASVLYPSKNDTLNIGVIGTGDRGGGFIPIINEMEGLNVVACADVLPFRLQSGLEKVQGKANGYSDYRALLDNKQIDAVLIATPFSTHSQIAIDSLDAGKHVYCEKTLVKGYSAIKELVENASKSEKIFQTGHQYHSSRLYTHIVDLIQNGKIGKITAIECQWNRNGNWRRKVQNPEHERAINWRMYREFSGGLLAELCSHQLDFSNWVLNAVPTQVMGDGGIDYWKDGRETLDNVHMIYSYPNGVRAKFTCLTSNSKDDYLIKVFGDKGTIIIDYTKAWFYPEKIESTKEIGEVDGVSGATIKWDQEKGIPIEVEHLDPSKQALLDFRDSVFHNSMPKSNVLTGAKAAICVQMGLDALYNREIVQWKNGLLP